ncbi:MAG: hypothetical protein HY842_04465 [Bacteroidetes bacterium]|nr:hypothetical protein [Bacteroidota bacterium]
MRLLFHNFLVIAAFSFLLAHNLIPHHHHGKASVEAEHRHDEGDHDHDHSPLTFFHVDEVFFVNSLDLKSTAPSAIAAVVPFTTVFGKIVETKTSGFISNPSGHPPDPPFLKAFSFRGPPAV